MTYRFLTPFSISKVRRLAGQFSLDFTWQEEQAWQEDVDMTPNGSVALGLSGTQHVTAGKLVFRGIIMTSMAEAVSTIVGTPESTALATFSADSNEFSQFTVQTTGVDAN